MNPAQPQRPHIRAGQPQGGSAHAGQFARVDGAYLESSHATLCAGSVEQLSRPAPLAAEAPDDGEPVGRWAELAMLAGATLLAGALIALVLWAARNWAVGA